MKAHLLLVTSLCFLAVPGLARAEEAPPPIRVAERAAPARPAIDVETPPVAPATPRTYHLHEGFYLRTSLGFGDYRSSFRDHHSNNDFGEHGHTVAIDLLIGGSPSPGVSIGGGLLLEPLFGADYDRGGSNNGGGFSTLIGPFIDGFPDATKGWHLGGLVGLAVQSFDDVNGGGTSRAGGLGGAGWFGYDFWVAGEWAVGPQLRLMGMRTSNTKNGVDESAWARSFTLGVSAVFN